MRPLSRREFGLSFSLAAAPAARPNVILILADDQGYGDLSAHGHPEIKTPHLDRLHGASVRFTDFHAAPMCTPTRAQLMTGRNALFTRAMNVSSGRTLLRTDLPTMPEAFRAAGYRTGLFGKWHLGDTYPYRPQDRGFEESVWYPSSHIGSVPDAWNNDYFNDAYRHNNHLQRYAGYSGDVFFREAMHWIGQGGTQPFFVYLPLNVAHGPLFVPPEYLEPYQHLPRNIARYSAMVANIDANLGRLEALLRERGLLENTILIYGSDNGGTAGTMRFNAGRRGNKTQLWEGGHRVPLFMRWPAGGVGGGRDVNGLAQMQDLVPTLAELCALPKPRGFVSDGVSLAGVLKGTAREVPERTAIVQFSRMNDSRPKKGDAAVMRQHWRLVNGTELYDLRSDPEQKQDVAGANAETVARLRRDYDAWWPTVEPLLDDFLPVVVGADQENPVLASACEWADVFVDQGVQVRRGERKMGRWHVQVARAGEYEIALRRWPRDCDAGLGEGVPAHRGEDGEYPTGVALPIASARLALGNGFDETKPVRAADREAVFRMKLAAGRTTMQGWFLDAAGQPLVGAYYAYVERLTPVTTRAVPVLFDTDIMGDVDDVGAVAALHALANRGEARILGMGVSSKHAASPGCLAALNAFYRRPEIPIGINRGEGFLRDSKYATEIAAEFPHRLPAKPPDAVALYEQILAKQPDRSVVLITVGQLTNVSNLLERPGGAALVERKVRLWVCMGAQFPSGREANIWHDAAPARHAVASWPGRIVFSGFEIGRAVMTGGRSAQLPEKHPLRRAYQLYNGNRVRESWDQTAVLYGVRCVEQDRGLWTLSSPGECLIDEKGANTWRPDPAGRHQYLMERSSPARIAALIDDLMMA